MKIKSLTRALKKAGISIEDKSTEKWYNFDKREGNRRYFEAAGETHVLSWYSLVDEENVDCLHCKRKREKSDMMTDYFPGWFPKTIKSAINALTIGENYD